MMRMQRTYARCLAQRDLMHDMNANDYELTYSSPDSLGYRPRELTDSSSNSLGYQPSEELTDSSPNS